LLSDIFASEKIKCPIRSPIKYVVILFSLNSLTNPESSPADAGGNYLGTAMTPRRVLIQLVGEGVVIKTGANKNRKYKAAR